MSDATFKELCLDAVDAQRLGTFWGAVLGRNVVQHDDEPDVHLEGAAGEKSGLVWLNTVPESHTVKLRVHLDLRGPVDDVGRLVALGASVLREPDSEIRWTVMADPEGNEFCLFGPEPGDDPPSRTEPFELVLDCSDPLTIATWWADRLGGTAAQSDDGEVALVDAAGFPYPEWVFDSVPEPKTVKNRLHWDINLTAPDPSALVAAGARILNEPTDDTPWWVMADPEGNEFCAFAPQ